MRFELFIAARYLRAKRRQAVIGVITAISIIGVAAGVASLIIALAINNGFRQDLQERLLGSTSHVNLLRTEGDGIARYNELIERLSHTPHVMAAAPAIYDEVLISRGARAQGALVKGIIPKEEKRVSDLLNAVTAGSLDPLSRPAESGSVPPIVLGKGLADQIGATMNSVVTVTSPQGELTPFGIIPSYTRFKVVGIFNSGFYDYDNNWAFTSLAVAQKLEAVDDIATVIEFKLDDLYRAPEIGDQLAKEAGPGFMASNWMDQNRALFRALRLEKVVTFITIGLIVFVAALNILISLVMLVMEKTKDIAVLISMGVRRSQVRRIFILQGLLIGVSGTVIGLIVGYGLALLGAHYHFLTLSAEVYSIDYVPFAPRLTDALVVAAVAIVISLLATIYPSYTAAKILPAEALRYE